MKYGVKAGPIDLQLPYANVIEARCNQRGFSSPLAYAIAWRETIRGQEGNKWNAATVVSGDGGHGLFQLTSSWPSTWQDVHANTDYALEHFLVPAFDLFGGRAVEGDDLVRLVAAAFNAGAGTAWTAHLGGNVDSVTANHDYAADVLRQYQRLCNHQPPN